MVGPSETILKARLAPTPAHPRAMATLLEAVALWQGSPVRAALAAAESGEGSDSSLYREAFTDHGPSSRLYDAQTKLVRLGARDHDPELGRWMAKDPIRFAGGDANQYGYCRGDPVI
jgi:RHS repeat-associated protein